MVSCEQAACNALAAWLQAGLGSGVVVSQRWPDAAKTLPPKAVTILTAGDPTSEILQPRVVEEYEIHHALTAKLTVASIVDVTTACSALEAARTSYAAHCASASIHHAADSTNVVTAPTAVDLGTAVALANDFTTQIAAHVVAAAHANADTVNTLASADPVASTDLPGLLARVALLVSVLNSHYFARIYGWAVEHRQQPMQLDVWAKYEVDRDDLKAQLEPLLNKDTITTGFSADPFRNGCLVALADGWQGSADFLFDAPRINQTADSVQRSEFRLTFSGTMDVLLQVKAESPRMALLQLQLTAGVTSGSPVKVATVTPTGESYSGG